ncbi:hypothetical protein [Roseibium sp. RKSG952]|uniref:hypothetical protein n=1 Tax=Roseibium sp. RKSG952 TaxID=2529384 RepID=UPI0012BD1577|nr:hypothetical protein [Roseibium sp. RKSG952]MTH94852.1 hypothetical protein [Roseibium sp. RKSG952]
MRIRIETDDDTHDCEICGGSYAYGGMVFVDDVLVVDKPASAHCFNGSSYNEGELLVMALKKLGHEVVVDNHLFHVTCHDDDYHGPLDGD